MYNEMEWQEFFIKLYFFNINLRYSCYHNWDFEIEVSNRFSSYMSSPIASPYLLRIPLLFFSFPASGCFFLLLALLIAYNECFIFFCFFSFSCPSFVFSFYHLLLLLLIFQMFSSVLQLLHFFYRSLLFFSMCFFFSSTKVKNQRTNTDASYFLLHVRFFL